MQVSGLLSLTIQLQLEIESSGTIFLGSVLFLLKNLKTQKSGQFL